MARVPDEVNMSLKDLRLAAFAGPTWVNVGGCITTETVPAVT